MKKRILIIEDDQLLRENTKEILELSNYEVGVAVNGVEGVKAAQNESPDLIICDIMMPELDGYGVLYSLSKEPRTACIPFIFLSAKAEPSDIRKGMGMGADDYLTKPFEEMDLLQAIEVRLKRAELLNHDEERTGDILGGFVDRVSEIAALADLYKDRKSRKFKKKETIYYAGDTAHFVHYLKSGRVKLVNMNEDGKEYISSMVAPGEFFGYLPIMEGKPYVVSAVALEDAEVHRIPREDFEELLHADRDVRNAFIRLLADNVYEKESKLLSLAYDSVRKRTANALLNLHERALVAGTADAGLEVARQDLASMVGTATESVIRTLSEFKEDGAVEMIGKKIKVVKPELLKAVW
jgi:CRP-like cAMP-binding protein